jgi:hypothetical protein
MSFVSIEVSQYMVRVGDRLFLSLSKFPFRTLANPEFAELLTAIHVFQFGEAQAAFFKNALDQYVYVESCRECVMEALHRFRWVNVSFPVGCSRGHVHGLGWIDGGNDAPHIPLAPEKASRYEVGSCEDCPPYFRNGGRGKIDAYWKRLAF